jgi:hypothetical protein
MSTETDREAIRNARPVVVDQPARLMTVSRQTGAPDIRLFDVKAINDQITRHVSILKEDETVVASGFVDREGAHVAIVGKVKQLPGDFRWTVLTVVDWNANWDIQAGFRWGL